MRKRIFPFSAALICCSCNSKSGEAKKDGTDSTGVSPATKVVRLDPASIDLNKPIEAAEANYQVNCWDGKKIEVAGYGYVFYGDSLETKMEVELTDSLGGSKRLVDCRLSTAPAMLKIAKTDMIHVRGRIIGNFNGEINMDSCEIVSVAKTIATQPVDPFSKALMNAADLSRDYYKWEGKEIAVVGDYYMTTTSTTSYGKSIRVDLKKPGTYDKVVGCTFKEDPSEKIRVNEKGIIIRGKIKTYTPYGYLDLEECSLVNR